MEANFDRCLSLVLKSEGGFVNDRHDPGGATNHGVTQAVYDAHRKLQGLVPKSVQLITGAEVASIPTSREANENAPIRPRRRSRPEATL